MQTTTKCDFAIAVRSHQITTSSSTMALPQSPLHQETPKQSTSHTYSSNSLALSLPLSLPSTHYCRYAALVATPLFDAPKTLTSKTKAAASLVLSLVLFLSHTQIHSHGAGEPRNSEANCRGHDQNTTNVGLCSCFLTKKVAKKGCGFLCEGCLSNFEAWGVSHVSVSFVQEERWKSDVC